MSLHDLAATFLEVAGLPVPEEMDSRSLRPVLDGSSSTHRDIVLSGLVTPRRAWHLACDGRYKLVRVDGEPPILFDLYEDPWEDTDIAADRPAVVARLQAWLDAELAEG